MRFTEVFSEALRGSPCVVDGFADGPRTLPVRQWTRAADAADIALLDLCQGPTLDIGCGPGRMAAALQHRGTESLGIDVVPEAVEQARRRGATALRLNVFSDDVPGQGSWGTALLADGNIGIGGDPVGLLQRARQLLGPRGRVVVELDGPGVVGATVAATIACGAMVSAPFAWSVVGVDGVGDLARAAGMVVGSIHRLDVGDRWAAVLAAWT